MSTVALHTTSIISETVRHRGLVQRTTNRKRHNGVSNGHATVDITWPQMVKLVTTIRLERNILKTAGDRVSVLKDHQ